MKGTTVPVFALLFGILSIFVPAAGAQVLTPPKPALPAHETTPADYIHYHEAELPDAADAADRLQTAVVRFEKAGTIVDLVSVVHLGDAAYYEKLNEKLKLYDAVLYEMVGGPHQPDDPAGKSAVEQEMGSIRQLQKMAKSFLGLEYQLDGIDYTAPNFVHADVAWEEMNALMTARNESILTLFTRASELAEQGGVAGVPSDAAAMEAMMKRTLQAVLTGNSSELKRTIAPFLSEAETFITQLEGEDGSVLVSERNRVVMEKLAALRHEKPGAKFAIFYGAGHMPDFEKRLLAEGFRKSAPVWLDAWSMPLNQTTIGTMTQVSPADLMIRLLSDNPEVMTGLQELGTILEDLGGTLKSLETPGGQ